MNWEHIVWLEQSLIFLLDFWRGACHCSSPQKAGQHKKLRPFIAKTLTHTCQSPNTHPVIQWTHPSLPAGIAAAPAAEAVLAVVKDLGVIERGVATMATTAGPKSRVDERTIDITTGPIEERIDAANVTATTVV